jgi:hypothetical protein
LRIGPALGYADELYLVLEPYLLYSFRGHTLQDIIGVVVEDTGEGKTADPESVTKYANRIYDKFAIHRWQDLFRLAETLDRKWKDDDK